MKAYFLNLFNDLHAKVDAAIASNPKKVVVVALAVGMLVGAVFL